jgi:RNA polymerase sigma-70 factor (ECF subfamily)
VADSRPRFVVDPERAGTIRQAFFNALTQGELKPLANLLAEDAVLVTDGGGKRLAAYNPILGRDKILRFYQGVLRKNGPVCGASGHAVLINGLPGLLITEPQGVQTAAFDIDAQGRIIAVYVVRNPDKLTHLQPH